jgi:hypothetical protein
MALPQRTQTLNTFYSATAEVRRPDLIDNFYRSAPLIARLRRKDSIKLKGGTEIRVSHIYAGFPAGSYSRGSEFDTSTREFVTTMIFDWKFLYAPINLDVIDIDLNDSPEAVFDLVDAAMENGELSLVDEMATQIYGDGTGNAGKDLDGLANAISRSTSVSYGGITRSATAGDPGNSILAAAEDTTGGVLSFATLNTNFGSAVQGRIKPDLLVTTQSIWNTIWERSQPSERNTAGDMRDIGYEVVRFNSADVTVDSHCPTGFIYGLNTEYWEFYVHSKWDFRFRGFMEPTNQQKQIGQLIAWCNLVCRAPRFQFVMSGITG